MAVNASEYWLLRQAWGRRGLAAWLAWLVVLVSCLPAARGQAQQQEQQQPVLLSSQASLTPGNATCSTSYNGTTDCTLSGAHAALAPFAALLAPGQRLRLVGQALPNQAQTSLALNAQQPVSLESGQRLELWSLLIGPATLSSSPVDPLNSLAIAGISLAACSNNCTAGSPQLGIYNSTLLLECSAWVQLQQALCFGTWAPADVEVRHGSGKLASLAACMRAW